MEPTAAPIRVFSEALRILSSKRIMQIATTAPTAADIHGSPPTGFNTYPAAMRKAVKINLIITTSPCIMRNLTTPAQTRHQKPRAKPRWLESFKFFNKKDGHRGPPFFVLYCRGFSVLTVVRILNPNTKAAAVIAVVVVV